uniref:Wsv134-like protein n=1 Tax=Trachysalambria curvirostris nimavirus TaxID=2984282 RepID=A0A9C7BWR5_9VIRU|nr:MAG: wsv134-like protein [Trachysalambria curvirostris nimavirus]
MRLLSETRRTIREMHWFGNRSTSRQGLFRTHIGRALIKSAARQAAILETTFGRDRQAPPSRGVPGDIKGMASTKGEQGEGRIEGVSARGLESVKPETEISRYIIGNPFLRRYANLIDNLALSSIPPELQNDTVLHMADSKNATVKNISFDIRFVLVDGKLCFYPTQQIGQKILCGSEGQEAAMFFNSANNKWTHGCNNSFEVIDVSIAARPGFREIALSSRDIRRALCLEDSERLDITHFFNYFFYNDN